MFPLAKPQHLFRKTAVAFLGACSKMLRPAAGHSATLIEYSIGRSNNGSPHHRSRLRFLLRIDRVEAGIDTLSAGYRQFAGLD